MKKLKLAWTIYKKMNADKIILTFLLFIFIGSFILDIIEPQINSIFDGIWYLFVSFTTIGFGDIVVTTIFGKIITMIIALYGTFIVALITGILINYYQELNKIKENESIELFLNKLENLEKLSNDELTEISDKIKKKRNKI